MAKLGDNLSVAVQEKELPPKRSNRNQGPLSGKTRRIILDNNDDISPSGLFVSVNGNPFLIRPGIAFDCPEAVIEVLDNAVVSMPVIDPNTLQVTGHRDRMRFSYRNAPLAA